MKTTNQVVSILDEALEDSVVVQVFSHLAHEMSQDDVFEVEVSEDKYIKIPADVSVSILTKVFVKDYTTDLKFGVYRVQIGIGDVVCRVNGIVEVQYCFATLYFNDEKKLNTFDFHTIMR
jgi:hypothetical protein